MSYVAAGVAIAGLGTTIYGKIKAGQAQKKLENAQSPAYTPSQSISDYYDKALQRYSVNPYNSAQYQQQQQNIQNETAAGLQTLQGRGGAASGAGALVAGGQEAQLSNTAQAQQQGAQALGQLGQAAGAQTQQGEMTFDINQQQPFTRNYNLLAMKAGGANQLANAGIATFNSGLNSLASQQAMKKYGYLGGNQTNSATAPVGGYQSGQIPGYNQAAAGIPNLSSSTSLPY